MSDSMYIPRLKKTYKEEISLKLKDNFNLKNSMLIPRIEKIILNMGLGDAKLNKNSLKQAQEELSVISGQKAVITYSKKAISNLLSLQEICTTILSSVSGKSL